MRRLKFARILDKNESANLNQKIRSSVNCYILTCDRPVNLWISKQDMHLYLKVNKGQQKCQVNCVGRVRNRPKKYITTEDFKDITHFKCLS